MNSQQIAVEVSRLKKKQKDTFQEMVMRMLVQIHESMSLRPPYRLVLDANIVMRLEAYSDGRVAEGLLSILVVFDYIKRLPFHIDVVVRPAAFHEFLRMKNLENTREHWMAFKRIKTLIEDGLGSRLLFDGMETFADAEHVTKLIDKDAKTISSTLQSYQVRSWRFDFVRPPGGFTGALLGNGYIEVSPEFAADGLYERVALVYFDEPRARSFFMQHIERRLREDNAADRRIMAKYPERMGLLMTKILKLTAKGTLKGLADIDMFTTCNVSDQFSDQAHGRYAPTSIGLSIDRNLSDALLLRSSTVVPSGELKGGAEHTADNEAKLAAMTDECSRLREGDKRRETAFEIEREFVNELVEQKIFF